MHNDFGLAAANTVSAIRAGVDLVSVTVGGIGERAGNAPLEKIVEILDGLEGYDTGINKARLPALVNLVSNACNLSARPMHRPPKGYFSPERKIPGCMGEQLALQVR